MTLRTLAFIGLSFLAGNLVAQDGLGGGDIKQPEKEMIEFVRSQPTSQNRSPLQMSAKELRQARALYRSQLRIQRLEYNKSIGYNPLRPHWGSFTSPPIMRRTIYVPIYIR